MSTRLQPSITGMCTGIWDAFSASALSAPGAGVPQATCAVSRGSPWEARPAARDRQRRLRSASRRHEALAGREPCRHRPEARWRRMPSARRCLTTSTIRTRCCATLVAGWLAGWRRIVITVPGGPMSAYDQHIGHRRHFTPSAVGELTRSAGLQVSLVAGAGFRSSSCIAQPSLLVGSAWLTTPRLTTGRPRK